jgi:branched-subunit amino acid aminotransferase/4-amino-4-deoxychorismate lyase
MTEKEQHIIFNGEVVLASTPLFLFNNRGFNYGDGIFETMHGYGTDIQFINDHFERLNEGLNALKISFTGNLQQAKIEKEIKRLLNRDKLFEGVRIRLAVFRDSEGLFTPKTNNASYIISCTELDSSFYKLNQKGLVIDIYNEIPKSIQPYSGFKTANSLPYVMAGLWAKEHDLDDCLIVNDKMQIIEGFHSNVFVVKNQVLYTPALSEGCVKGIMRIQIIRIANELGLKVFETTKMEQDALLDADEIFLTNAVEGIRWVVAYKNKRYFNKVARALNENLNTTTFNKL